MRKMCGRQFLKTAGIFQELKKQKNTRILFGTSLAMRKVVQRAFWGKEPSGAGGFSSNFVKCRSPFDHISSVISEVSIHM